MFLRLCILSFLYLCSLSTLADGFEVRLAEDKPSKGMTKTIDLMTGRDIYIYGTAVINQKDISDITFGKSLRKGVVVTIKLNPNGSEKLFSATKGQLRQKMAVILNGKVIVAPMAVGPMGGGMRIPGRFSDDILNELFTEVVLN